MQAWPSLPLHQMLQARQRVMVSRVEAMSDKVASYSVGMTAMPGDPSAMHDDVVYSLPMRRKQRLAARPGLRRRLLATPTSRTCTRST